MSILEDATLADRFTRHLRDSEESGLLRFLTCGSVDDGKSTLIGRLLYDCKALFDDELVSLKKDSRILEASGDEVDLASLLDGLEAERQQGITIDVAYRFFATSKRKFIVADTPGHEQYTRNMATGASTADLAVLLVDARTGVVAQTRHHSRIVSMLGIKHVVLAVNKMDLVEFDKTRFNEIISCYNVFAERLNWRTMVGIPVSARFGDNVVVRSVRMPWYTGPTLVKHLETIDVEEGRASLPARFPVQWVNRPNQDFRGYSGTLVSGRMQPGETVLVAGSSRTSKIARLVTFDGDLAEAKTGEALTIVLEDEIDIRRGDMLVRPNEKPEFADQLAAELIWMSDDPLLPGRSYVLKAGTRAVPATVTEIKFRTDIETGQRLAAKELHLNELGFCNLSLDSPIAFDPYNQNRETGSFILIDRFSNATASAGLIRFGLRRASNIPWQHLTIGKSNRAAHKGHKAAIVWFTGLSGAGKSTVADFVERKLFSLGCHTYLLDGDNLRHGLNRDLGFTEVDRVENIRRIAEVAKLFVDAGMIVLVSSISPFRADRRAARELVTPSEFIEVFVDTPIEECRRRDPKGLYRKADAGELINFTGVDSPYEPPEAPEVHLHTTTGSAADLAEVVLNALHATTIVRL